MKRIDEKIGKRTQKTRKERKRLRKQLPRPQLFPIITHPFSIPGPGLSLSLSHISGNCMDTIPVFYLSKSMFMGGGCWSYEVREKEGRVSICVCGGLTPINGFHGLDRVLHSGFISGSKKLLVTERNDCFFFLLLILDFYFNFLLPNIANLNSE